MRSCAIAGVGVGSLFVVLRKSARRFGNTASACGFRATRVGLERRVVLRVPQFASAPFVVASSDLLLTAPEGLAHWARPFLDLVELAPPMDLPAIHSYATWHERSQGDPAQRWFRANVVRAASREAGGED